VASFIPAPKTVRITQAFADADGHLAQCRAYIAYTGAVGIAADYTAIAGGFADAISSSLMPYLHSSWTQDVTIATDLSTDTSPEGEVTIATAGSLTGGRLPASTAVVVSQTTGRRYRGGHSRVYIPAGDDTKLVTDATWDSTFVANVATAWETGIIGASSAFWGGSGTQTWVMASFYSGFTNVAYGTPTKYRRVPTGRAAAVNFPVLTTVGKIRLGTQRRRLAA
jgi:hypothetical protein